MSGPNELDDFLNPRCSLSALDTFVLRRAILSGLCAQLEKFKGVVLDIGCGYMPYKRILLSPPSGADEYIGLDLNDNIYQRSDLAWDGITIPLRNDAVDCALATEVFEHCAQPEVVMAEACRVLKPAGRLFFTVPFLWPLHCVPYDEYRYTPFALERHLRNAGFVEIEIKALGGWDASLAQLMGLWLMRRPMSPRKRAILSRLALPIVRHLAARDRPPREFTDDSMITGLSGTAVKPAA